MYFTQHYLQVTFKIKVIKHDACVTKRLGINTRVLV